jgi:ribonuclease-3
LDKELLEANIRQDSKTILGDALEAIIGAIYLDRGFEKTQEFIVKKLIGTYMDIEHLINTEVNFKSKVIEWAQKNKTEIEFVTHEKIVNNQSVFEAFLYLKGEEKTEGMGKSKKVAEQAAAEKFFLSLFNED